MNKIDFYAQTIRYFKHIFPVWKSLPESYRGIFYINPDCAEIVEQEGIPVVHSMPFDSKLTLVCSYDDYQQTKGDVIWMDHGIGNTYSNDNPFFAGSSGKDRVVLFLNPHQVIQDKNKATYPKAKHAIIGYPKMDSVSDDMKMRKGKKTVCLSFRWDNKEVPEMRSAFSHYESVLSKLADSNDFNLVFHGHPKEEYKWREIAGKYGIKKIKNLERIFEIEDVYVCDNSSSMYEFASTGKPVVVLNCPYYRKDVNHGIRFWDYMVGEQVDDPKELYQAIIRALDNPKEWVEKRKEITKLLFPYRFHSAEKASGEIVKYMDLNCTKSIVFYSKGFYTGGMENAVYHLIRLLNKSSKKYDITVAFRECNETMERMLLKLSTVAHIQCVIGQTLECDVLINCDRIDLVLPFIKATKTIHWFHSNMIQNKDLISPKSTVVSQSNWHHANLLSLGIKSTTIGNPLDVDYILKQSKEKIEDFGDKKVYVIASRLSREKGFDHAFKMMRGHLHDNSLLVIVGGSQSKFGDSVKQQAEILLGKCVLFVGEKDNPYPYIKRADYVMCLSDHEIYGLVSEEAHILGRPVIFNRYETATDQFIQGFDSWRGELVTVGILQHDFSKVRKMVNEDRFEKWEALINE